ncbi:CHC2 zinc finger domain-containing protein [Peribacillus asahii]|nr:CHC2 zinc finger domain-containing protein [Peribacillus asahii]
MISQIKAKVDIVTVIEESPLHLRKRGRNFIGLCPFHSEKTPSFSVNPQKNIFKCFGCGVSGDQINLYARLNHINNGQAISQLSKRVGLTGKKLNKKQRLEVIKWQEDKELEKKFTQKYNEMFYFLCELRDYMKERAGAYKTINHIEKDSLLMCYYHAKAIHEDLLNRLLAGLHDEIDFEQQIAYFYAAKGVVERWEKLLEKYPPNYSESTE